MTAFTNLIYSEFDTTQANLLADLRTAILSSASWSRPNSGSKPDTYKCTTTRGVNMVFDLSDAAITTQKMTIGVWRDYDGSTFTDKVSRYLYWKTTAGASTNPLHCIVSASKEHIFISVEGPRANEAGADSASTGSLRQHFALSDVVPYFGGDVATVFVGGNPQDAASGAVAGPALLGHISQNYAGTTPWNYSRLLTLGYSADGASLTVNFQRTTTGDGKYYLSPFVVASDVDGLRGRLAAFFHAGWGQPDVNSAASPISPPPVGSKVTFDGNTYKLLQALRVGTNVAVASAFGAGGANTLGSGGFGGPVIAVPTV